MKKLSRQAWTMEEENKLYSLASEGKTNEAIARELGRTKSAVAHKRARLFSSIEERQGNVSDLFEGTVGANAVYEAVPVENVTYCDDPHRPEEITAEDDLMKEVSDVIDRLNTLSDALAGTSEFMEELSEGQKIIKAEQKDQQRQLNEIARGMTEIKERINVTFEKYLNLKSQVEENKNAHNRTVRALADVQRDMYDVKAYLSQSPLWRLFHPFKAKKGAAE